MKSSTLGMRPQQRNGELSSCNRREKQLMIEIIEFEIIEIEIIEQLLKLKLLKCGILLKLLGSNRKTEPKQVMQSGNCGKQMHGILRSWAGGEARRGHANRKLQPKKCEENCGNQ